VVPCLPSCCILALIPGGSPDPKYVSSDGARDETRRDLAFYLSVPLVSRRFLSRGPGGFWLSSRRSPGTSRLVPITICVNKAVDSLYVIQVFLKVEIEFMLSSSRFFFFFLSWERTKSGTYRRSFRQKLLCGSSFALYKKP
jgi:hypothetical protein